MPKETPLIYSAPMVRAILEGRKTQTRRVIKKAQFENGWAGSVHEANISGWIAWYPGNTSPEFTKKAYDYGFECPYGKIGDRLWVRETFLHTLYGETNVSGEYDTWWGSKGCKIEYCADGAEPHFLRPNEYGSPWMAKRPSIFMPRWASRINLEITNIRVERINDISEEDAKAEGVGPLFTKKEIHEPRYHHEFDLNPMPYKNYLWHGHIGKTITSKQACDWPYQYSSYKTAKDSFSSLWQSINGKKYPWSSNPWVWVIEFKRIAP